MTILAPLSAEHRAREPHVEAHFRRLMAGPVEAFWRAAAQPDRDAPDWIQEETLVCVLRAWQRQGRGDEAWRLAEILVERSARFVWRQVSCWRLLSQQHMDDCVADVNAQMLSDLFSDGRSSEFWEIRFWLCLKRRLLNIVQKYRRIAETELYPEGYEAEEEGRGDGTLLRAADPQAQEAFKAAEVREALALLGDNERAAFVLYHYHEWGQQEIAEHLGVTDRTVRNLLTRAEKRLATWRDAH